ncbi:Transcriptional regulator ManR [Frankliniella fusca]|uniref:Transcriptional regulator ManR n=1 Tax=Frankliniella fusca TaxID=407009 RepID=A0AAE1HQ69_9NEOP|nr:Transcriptional regulator ManR [Frankliniella fusca]
MKGHAGYHSCPKCFVRGKKSARTGQVMVFPHQENLLLRNDQNNQECVTKAVASKCDERGVSGPTVLSYMVYSSFIRSTNIDSMHALSLGIVEQLLRLWFDSKYSDESFSLVKFVDKFSKEFEVLYGVRHMSSNIHLLRHLATSVVDCGNLCVTSCFKFEDLNGKLAALVHGTKHATKQIYSNLQMLSELPLLVAALANPHRYFAYMSRSDHVPVENLERYVIYCSANEKTDLISIEDILTLSWCLTVNNISYLIDPLNKFEME